MSGDTLKYKNYRNRLIAGCLLLGILSSAQAAPVMYDVSGIKGELLDNVKYYLAALPVIDSQRAEGRQAKISDAIIRSLQAMGYYSPKIDFKFGS